MTAEWRETFEGQTTLVLGAGGFIGRRVCRMLEPCGARVIRGVRPGRGATGGEGTEVDLAIPGAAAALVRRLRPAIVCNLAGYGVSPAEQDTARATRINAELPEELAQAVASTPVGDWPGLRLVHAGSALEYGTAGGNLHEGTTPLPTTLYGRTKLAGTEAVARGSAATGGRTMTARLFTVYGPGERPGRLLPSLLAARTNGHPLPMTAGLQRRDFTFVDDVVEGLLRLAAAGPTPEHTVNLATGVLTTVRDFVQRAARTIDLADDQLQFGTLPGRAEEMSHDPVSVERLQRLTGWKPTTGIEEGVRRTLVEEPPPA